MKSKEQAKKADSKLSVKTRGGVTKAPAKSAKNGKDPNMPKRPATAFFVFLEDFRQQFKEKHPNNKSGPAVGKAAGQKWKSMSDAEKATYISKAAKRKAEYEKNIKAYNKKAADEELEKPKSEANDNEEDDEDDGSGEEENDEE